MSYPLSVFLDSFFLVLSLFSFSGSLAVRSISSAGFSARWSSSPSSSSVCGSAVSPCVGSSVSSVRSTSSIVSSLTELVAYFDERGGLDVEVDMVLVGEVYGGFMDAVDEGFVEVACLGFDEVCEVEATDERVGGVMSGDGVEVCGMTPVGICASVRNCVVDEML